MAAAAVPQRAHRRDHAQRDRKSPRSAVRWLRHRTGDCSCNGKPRTATDFRFGFEITMYVAAR